jgi:hypothetical protein
MSTATCFCTMILFSLQTPQFFLNRKDGSIVATFLEHQLPGGGGSGGVNSRVAPPNEDLIHLPFARPRPVLRPGQQAAEDFVSLEPMSVRSRSEPRRKKSGQSFGRFFNVHRIRVTVTVSHAQVLRLSKVCI